MRAVVQRCAQAEVRVDEDGESRVVGSIDRGIIIYLGVARDDTDKDADYLARKAAELRIFMDDEEKMNLSILDLGLDALVVSQFTLLADARKGRRPSYSEAAPNEVALRLYGEFCERLAALGPRVEKGSFGAMMRVSYINEGPVTILLDSKKLF